MKIPQSMQELRRMRPEEQRATGEMLGRLLATNPDQVSQVTQIDPAELQALLQPAQTQQAPAAPTSGGQPSPQAGSGATMAPAGAPGQPSATQPQPAGQPASGTHGVLQDLAPEEGLTMRDSQSGQSRPAKPGEHPGPTELLMHGSEILQMGIRAHASVRMRENAKKEAKP